MYLFRLWINKPYIALIWHVLLGAITRFAPAGLTAYYVLIIGWGFYEILRNRDKNHLTAYYVLYVMGLEIVYRVGKFYIFWELGKYGCLALLTAGLIACPGNRLKITWPFLIYGVLIVPGVLTSLYLGYTDPDYLRKIILQHISGPLSLMMSGLYFYKSRWRVDQLYLLLKIAVLPAVSLVVLLFLGSKVSEISFSTSSNFAASGGFGPNQVSTAIGYGMAVIIFALLNGWTLTANKITDIGLLLLLIFRGLLTFSRGGFGAAILASVLALAIVMLFNASYQRKFINLSFRIFLGGLFLVVTALFVNKLTNNFLLYRYLNKSGTEIVQMSRGQKIVTEEKTILSGREIVMIEEWKSFKKSPFFGVGAGRGTLERESIFNYSMASHTEQTRLLGEHGILGLLALLIFFIGLPVHHFRRYRLGLSRHWFLHCFILVMLTMMHAGMRLAMPGILFGVAFICLYNTRKPETLVANAIEQP